VLTSGKIKVDEPEMANTTEVTFSMSTFSIVASLRANSLTKREDGAHMSIRDKYRLSILLVPPVLTH